MKKIHILLNHADCESTNLIKGFTTIKLLIKYCNKNKIKLNEDKEFDYYTTQTIEVE